MRLLNLSDSLFIPVFPQPSAGLWTHMYLQVLFPDVASTATKTHQPTAPPFPSTQPPYCCIYHNDTTPQPTTSPHSPRSFIRTQWRLVSYRCCWDWWESCLPWISNKGSQGKLDPVHWFTKVLSLHSWKWMLIFIKIQCCQQLFLFSMGKQWLISWWIKDIVSHDGINPPTLHVFPLCKDGIHLLFDRLKNIYSGKISHFTVSFFYSEQLRTSELITKSIGLHWYGKTNMRYLRQKHEIGNRNRFKSVQVIQTLLYSGKLILPRRGASLV